MLSAQQNEFNWRIGFYAGVMNYHGDLSYKFIDPNEKLVDLFDNMDYLSYAASLEKRLSDGVSLGLIYTQGEFIANDRSIDWSGDLRTGNPEFLRSLNVNTKIKDLSLYATFHFDNGNILGRRAFVAPYFKIGGGFMLFQNYGDLFYGPDEDQRYYYWDDYTIRDRPPGSNNAQIIEQDGEFETELRPLQTEGKDYNNNVFTIGGAFGLKFRLGNRINLNLEVLARLATTDYLDDVSGDFLTEYESDLQQYAANPANIDREMRGDDNEPYDFYSFTSLSLHYNFGRRKRAFSVPAIAVGPLMGSATHSAGGQPLLFDTGQPMTPMDTIFSVNDSLRTRNDSLEYLADSLQYLADSLQHRLTVLLTPPDSVLADSLRRVADSLYMRADSLYPGRRRFMPADSATVDSLQAVADSLRMMLADTSMIRADSLSQGIADSLAVAERDTLATGQDSLIVAQRDSLAGATPDSLAIAQREAPPPDTIFITQEDTLTQAQIADLQDQVDLLSDSVLIYRTRLEAAQVYEPVSDDLPQEDQVETYQTEAAQIRSDIDEQRASEGVSPEVQAQLDEMEEMMSDYEDAIEDMERAAENNDDDYDDLKREVERLRKQLNITTGVGATAGLGAALAGSGRSKQERKAQEEAEAQMAAMQAQIDSLNRMLAGTAAVDTISADSARILMQQMQGDSLATPEEVTTANDSLRALFNQQRNENAQLKAQRDSLQRALAETGGKPRPPLTRQSVYFAINSAALSPQARRTVEEIANFAKEDETLNIYLEGYTDPSGSVQYNRALSGRRTQSVRDYLLGLGISAGRIVANPLGEDTTITDPTLGRRVDLILRTGE